MTRQHTAAASNTGSQRVVKFMNIIIIIIGSDSCFGGLVLASASTGSQVPKVGSLLFFGNVVSSYVARSLSSSREEMVLFSLINVWFNKGGFEYTSV